MKKSNSALHIAIIMFALLEAQNRLSSNDAINTAAILGLIIFRNIGVRDCLLRGNYEFEEQSRIHKHTHNDPPEGYKRHSDCLTCMKISRLSIDSKFVSLKRSTMSTACFTGIFYASEKLNRELETLSNSKQTTTALTTNGKILKKYVRKILFSLLELALRQR